MEIFRALAVLAEPPVPGHERVRNALGLGPPPSPADHADCFVFRFYPFASVYLGPEGMIGGVARDRIAGFWRVLGIDLPPEPDEIVVMLAFYASLCDAGAGELRPERRAAIANARRSFLREHLLSWIPVYAAKVAAAGPRFYRGWAQRLLDALREEHDRIEDSGNLPAHLREAAGPPAGDGHEEIVSWLLAPVRSGFILLRDDLENAAGDLGRPLRAMNRRQMLAALLAENPRAVLSRLAEMARAASAAHCSLPGGNTAAWWSARAKASAEKILALETAHRMESRG